MAVAPTPVAAAPDAPDRAQRATFSARATAFFDWIKNTFVAGVNALASVTYSNAIEAATQATAAAASASAASGSVAAAQSSAAQAALYGGAAAHNPATNYAVGAVVKSNVNYAPYKCRAAGIDASDPSANADKWKPAALEIDTGYPIIRPTLILDFANSRYVDPRITFTRASTATRINERGLIETVAAGVPRIDYDPATGECRGLPLEEARTNLLTYSEQFNNAVWGKTNCTINANTEVAPDGTTTADSIVNPGNATSLIYSNCIVPASSTNDYYASIFVKPISPNTCCTFNTYYSGSAEANINFYFNTKTIAGTPPYAGGYIFDALPNGWFRIGYRVARDATGTATSLFYRLWQSGRGNTTGDCYVWGAQLEPGTSPTSYIPTAPSAVTRAAEVPTMTGANFSSWYRPDEGTFVVFARSGSISAGRLITLSDGTADNQIRINLAVSSNSLRADLEVVAGGVSQVSTTTTPVFAVGSMVAIAFAYKANDFAISVNGGTVVTDTSGTVPTVDRMHIGTDHAGANSHNGTVARIAYYPKRLLELQSLSAQ